MGAFNPEKYDPREDSSKGHEKDGVVVLNIKTKTTGEGDEAKTVESDQAGLGQFPKGGQFTPGGDAKLKGVLIRAHVTGTKIVRKVNGKAESPVTALAYAKRFGWEDAIKAAKTRLDERAAASERARKAREEKAAEAKAEREAKAAKERDEAIAKASK